MRPAKRWMVAPVCGPHETRESATAPPSSQKSQPIRLSRLVGRLLANRGLTQTGDVESFLNPKLSDLPGPESLPGCMQAAARIVAAIRDSRKIVIYCDYDVDGTTGAAILWHAITLAGGQVDFYVPHRLDEGYGLNSDALESISSSAASMVITVDCGITAVEQVERARKLGLELIITDHHEPGPQLPAAEAIVHPALSAAGAESYPNRNLCGAGVAMKLAWAIGQTLSQRAKVSEPFRKFLIQCVTLAALGTVADVVPLLGENRVLVWHGLRGIKHSGLIGLDALIDSAGLRGEKVDAYHIGFTLAPRLNAAGRMDDASKVVELFTLADADRARQIAEYLQQHNRDRQAAERAILQQAVERLDADPRLPERRSIVLADPGWHPGVIGIVASRLVDRYHRPTVLVGMQNGVGQGSARCIPLAPGCRFTINQALAACKDSLLSFGGHAMAGGIKVAADRFPAFADAFEAFAGSCLTADDLRPRLRIDAEVTADDLTFDTVRQVLALAPFGMGNPRPVLAARGCTLANPPRRVGRDGAHLQFHVRITGQVFSAIAFDGAGWEQPLTSGRPFDMAFEPDINTYQDRSSVQLCVKDIRWADS